MSVQYISDEKGHTTGVFIPIEEWNNLKSRYEGIEDNIGSVPTWQQQLVNERREQTPDDQYVTWDEVRKQLNIE